MRHPNPLGYNPGDEHEPRIYEGMNLADTKTKFWNLEICVKGTKRYPPKGWDQNKWWPGWPVFSKNYTTMAGAQRAAKKFLPRYNSEVAK
tara:strand:+ start:999 stop:1268 length:270 start_codon:yes stop_codon:yes gene_type:complete